MRPVHAGTHLFPCLHNCQDLGSNPGTSGTEVFDGQMDHTYTFRIWAKDHVDNETTEENVQNTAAVTKYYLFGGQRVAMHVRTGPQSAIYYLHGDHLGSTSVTANYAGTLISRTLYKPLHSIQGRLWGEVRYQSGTLPTQYTYTGQYSHTADFGLMYYVARWYDPVLGRFAQVDSLVPGAGQPMAWDRYHYGLNNPIRYNDPSGHGACDGNTVVPECEEIDPDGDGKVPLFDPLPDIEDIYSRESKEAVSDATRQLTVDRYELLRSLLYRRYGWAFIDRETGKILDGVILAFIIAGEFGTLEKMNLAGSYEAFQESLEALSNMYNSDLPAGHESYCGADTCSIEEQISLLYGVQSFRSSFTLDHFKDEGWQKYISSALAAEQDYSHGKDSSWMWGNVTADRLGNYSITASVDIRGTKFYSGYDYYIVYE